MFRVFSCLAGQHDWRLVALAGVICFAASLVAVTLFHRAQAAEGRAWAAWVAAAGTAAGDGIWATHFIAMLAYEPGVAVAYDVPMTVSSLIIAAALTAAGMGVALSRPSCLAAMFGGGVLGGGIAGMHYLGMSALELPGQVAWSVDLVVASIVLGMILAMASLALAARSDAAGTTLAAAVLLTLAIVSHHFTAMGAVTVVPDPLRTIATFSIAPGMLALGVAAATTAILMFGTAGAIVDRRLRDRSTQLDVAVSNMPQGLLMFDAQGRTIVWNRRYVEMYGLSAGAVRAGLTVRELLELRMAAGSFRGDPDHYAATIAPQGAIQTRLVELPDGRTIEVTNQPMRGGGWVSVHDDITERKRADDELRQTRAFLDTVVENMPGILMVKETRHRRYVLVNRAAEEALGVPRRQLLGKRVQDVFPEAEAGFALAHDCEVLRSGRLQNLDEHVIRTPRGPRTFTAKKLPILGHDGVPRYLLTLAEDITERKRAEDRIAYLARHDPLTDLPNRIAFAERLAATLADATASGQGFAVLSLDLDRFKDVNDVFGHAVGDRLLGEAVDRLRAASEGAFLARLGGDEFAVIASDEPRLSTVEGLAERLQAALADDIEVDGHRLVTSVSIGVALFPGDGLDATTLVGNADAALHRAKAEGRGAIRFFAAETDAGLREQRALQNELRSALGRGELALQYQPQARIDGEVVGFEALIRWHHPSRGVVPPGAFIPQAEESGLIVSIGEWVLREACREAASWPCPLQVAVNLSPVQFRHGDLAGLVHSVLHDTGLAAKRLELEITEGVLIGDFSRAVAILRRLKSLGVRIAMDDFGTGYSSLSYLQSFPFDKIKIDQAFISNLERNPQSAAIVRAVIALGRGLHLPVVAEGVETEDQRAFLAAEFCQEIQGYLVGPPAAIGHYAEAVGRPAADRPRAAVR